MSPARGKDSPNQDEDYRIALALSAHQVEALVLMIAESPTRDPALDELAWSSTEPTSAAGSPHESDGDSVFAAANEVVRGVQIDMAAEREAAEVAVPVLTRRVGG